MRVYCGSNSGYAEDSFNLGSVLASPTAAGLTLTNLFTSAQIPGNYRWSAKLWVVNVGTPTLTFTPGFSGTSNNISWMIRRSVASTTAPVVQVLTSFVASAGTASLLYAEMEGYFSATASGNFTLGTTRTAGTSATIQPGGQLELYRIA